MPRKSDKRERLLQAARSLIYRQGFHQTTLSDISQESGISLGNLYYYFKTKEEILAAVVEDRTERFNTLAEDWEQEPDPRKRLLQFLEMPITICDSIANHGCPVGSLSQELNKTSSNSSDLAHSTLKVQVDWVTEQFHLMGKKDAKALGHQFIATLQGASLLANALSQSEVLVEQAENVKKWVQAI